MGKYIENNFDNIIKVWIVVCIISNLFLKDSYILGMHVTGIMFYLVYCYKTNRKIKEFNIYWMLVELTALLKVIESIIK